MRLKKIFSFATLTLLVALTLSSIAAWYSVLGLTAIFAAAVVPIMIMGGSLEVAKVVTTVWLHRYWDRATWKLKLYLVPAVMALAFLTSMGIFGFLSKAHSDQSLVSGDVTAKVAIYDEKIKTAQANVDANRKALQQMDAQVDQLLGRTTDDKGANRAVQVRNQQKKERARLQAEITSEQESISKINEEAAPIRAEIRKVEAEVGPIKYIAAMIYGDNPDSNLLERAVRWVIILIVLVFDPLALILVLAAQSSYKWLDEDLKEQSEKDAEDKFVDTFLNSRGAISPDIDLDPEINLEKIIHDAEEIGHKLDTMKSDIDFINQEVTAHEDQDQGEIEIDAKDLQPVDVESDVVVGNHEPETHVFDSIEDPRSLDPLLGTNEVTVEKEIEPKSRSTKPEPIVKTEGVTFHETDGGYVQYNGKSVSKAALLGLHPELFAARPDSEQVDTSFGTEFPKFARKGDVFVRVDLFPNKVFKFDGRKWIEVNKEQSQSYLYDEAYIQHLIDKIDSGEYDPELLSESERIQIEEYLQR